MCETCNDKPNRYYAEAISLHGVTIPRFHNRMSMSAETMVPTVRASAFYERCHANMLATGMDSRNAVSMHNYRLVAKVLGEMRAQARLKAGSKLFRPYVEDAKGAGR